MNPVIPPDVVSLADYEVLAEERLTAEAWAYFSGGAGDEITLRENREAFDLCRLRPRVLTPLAGGHTRLTLLGRTFEHPIFLAPVAYHKLAHPEGELATVLGASAMKAGMILSTQASTSLEEVARAAATPLWFQLYIQPDRGFTRELVQRAEAAGYEALVVTVDAPVNGLRNREQRARFRLPEGVEAVNLKGMKEAAWETRKAGSGSVYFGGMLDVSATWADITWLQSITRLPVLVKGILAVEDARMAAERGLAGIVVSNHGGRTLDTVPSSLEVLPGIAEAVGGALPLILDGGIRRGTDILKAVALGASAVLVGRPCIHGLAVAGASGVAHVIHILRAELELAMVLTGRPTLAEVDASVLWEGR